MGIIDKEGIRDAYKKEARALITKIEKGLSSFNESRITSDERRIFQLFRYAHTLKGISGTCGYYKIEEAARAMEEIFQAAKDSKFGISVKDKDLIRKKLKACEGLLK